MRKSAIAVAVTVVSGMSGCNPSPANTGVSGGGGQATGNTGGGGQATGNNGGGGVGGGTVAPQTLDGAWQPIEIVSSDTDDDEVLGLGACGEGDAVIVWRRNTATVKALYASRYDSHAPGWSAPQKIADGVDNHEQVIGLDQGIGIAIGRNCDALVVWASTSTSGASPSLFAASYGTSSGWTQWPALADVAVASAGNFTAAISDSGDGAISYSLVDPVRVARIDYSPRTGFGSPVVTAAPQLASLFLGILPDGTGVQLYQQNATTPVTTNAFVRAADGSWTETALNVNGPTINGTIVELLPATDRFLVRWFNLPEGLGTLVAGQDVSSLTWPSDIANNFDHSPGASIAANGASLFYFTRDMGDSTFRVARYNSTAGWAAAETIGIAAEQPDSFYGGVIDDMGRAMVYYASVYRHMIMNRFTPEHGWSGPLQIAYSSWNGRPFISMDRRGDVVIAWGGFGGDETPSTDHVAALRYIVNP